MNNPKLVKRCGQERRRRSPPPAQGCAPQRATLGNQRKEHRNPERVADSCLYEPWLNLRTLSEFVTQLVTFRTQGVAPGLEFANAFGVLVTIDNRGFIK